MLRHVLRRSFSTASSATSSTFKHLHVAERGAALWITINRPDLHNAFNEQVISELTTAFRTLPSSPRCVVLTGAGKSFSAGADLNWMRKMADYTEEENERDSQQLFDMFAAIRFSPLPVIARVNGAALGGGSGLAAACDFAFALDGRAKFGFTEVRLGLVPAVISRFVMDKIGKRHAMRYFITGEQFDAREAQRIGLVEAAAGSVEELDALVDASVKHIASSSPAAVRMAKDMTERVSQMSLEDSKPYVTKLIASARVSDEGQEGLGAFLEKRKPSWIRD